MSKSLGDMREGRGLSDSIPQINSFVHSACGHNSRYQLCFYSIVQEFCAYDNNYNDLYLFEITNFQNANDYHILQNIRLYFRKGK